MTNHLKKISKQNLKAPLVTALREGFNAHGLVPPVFENFRQGFRSKEPDDVVNGAVSGGVNLLLDLIEKHPGRKVPFFVTHTSIPERTIQRRITKLKPDRIQRSSEDRRILDHRLKCAVCLWAWVHDTLK